MKNSRQVRPRHMAVIGSRNLKSVCLKAKGMLVKDFASFFLQLLLVSLIICGREHIRFEKLGQFLEDSTAAIGSNWLRVVYYLKYANVLAWIEYIQLDSWSGR